MSESERDGLVIRSHSIYGANTRRGLVGLTVGERKTIYMTPAQARSVATDLLQTAAAAEMDETTVLWLTREMELPIEQAAGALSELRKVRESLYPEISRPPGRQVMGEEQ